MAWDFSTDPEFQAKLDWVEQFCKEEVEPLEYVFPYAVRSRDPKVKAYVRGLQQQVKDQGLWAIFLDEELGGPGYGQLKLGLLNEILGRYPSAPQMFGAAAPDTGNMEMLAAYGTEEQKKRWLEPMLNQEMFSAYSMTEPQGGSDPNLFKTYATARRRRVGHQRREVVHERGAGRRHPLRDVHERHVRGAPHDAGRGDPARAPQPQPHHLPRGAGPPRPPARPGGRRQGARPAPARRRAHPPRDAHHRPVQARLRHDVRAGPEPRVARQDHRRAPDGAGEDRRLLRRHPHAAPVRARDGVEDRQHEHAGDPHRHRRGEVHDGQGAARRVVQRAAHPRLARHHQPHAAPGHVRRRADDGHRRRRRRGAQGHRRPQRPQELPPARGLLAHGVLPRQARRGVEEDAAQARRRPRARRVSRELQEVLRQPPAVLEVQRSPATGGSSSVLSWRQLPSRPLGGPSASRAALASGGRCRSSSPAHCWHNRCC